MITAAVASRGPLAQTDGVRGSVLAVFARSLYIAVDTDRLLVVHDSAFGHTPCSLCIADARPGGWNVAVGDRVAGRLGLLRVGRMCLDVRHARIWRPAPPVRPGPIIAAAPHAARFGNPCDWLGRDCHRLAVALIARGTGDIAASVNALVGAGPGLTPAGDDALVGMLCVLHRAAPLTLASGPLRLLGAAIPPLLARTSPFGAHYLRLALDGYFSEHLAALVDALSNSGDIPSALLARVLATGATSGADALAGVRAGLELIEAIGSTPADQEAA